LIDPERTRRSINAVVQIIRKKTSCRKARENFIRNHPITSQKEGNSQNGRNRLKEKEKKNERQKRNTHTQSNEGCMNTLIGEKGGVGRGSKCEKRKAKYKGDVCRL